MGWILPTAVLEYSLKHLRRTMRELLPLLPANARRFLLLFGVLSAVLSLLDAAALGVFALVLNQILKGGTMTLPVFGDVTQEFSLLILVASALVMILKSVLNIWLSGCPPASSRTMSWRLAPFSSRATSAPPGRNG
jgi:hypothetical protein